MSAKIMVESHSFLLGRYRQKRLLSVHMRNRIIAATLQRWVDNPRARVISELVIYTDAILVTKRAELSEFGTRIGRVRLSFPTIYRERIRSEPRHRPNTNPTTQKLTRDNRQRRRMPHRYPCQNSLSQKIATVRLTTTKSGLPTIGYCLRYRIPARHNAFANRFSIWLIGADLNQINADLR